MRPPGYAKNWFTSASRPNAAHIEHLTPVLACTARPLFTKVAETHQAAVPVARDAYLGAADTGEITRDVVVLDVRPVEEYLAGHIPGAVSIPVAEPAGRIAELPDDTEIVVYCRG